jgi:hypothetical protein
MKPPEQHLNVVMFCLITTNSDADCSKTSFNSMCRPRTLMALEA